MVGKVSEGAEKNQRSGIAKRLANLRPFVKGDPRINRSGRPKSFDHFRELAIAIAQEPIEVEVSGKKVTICRAEKLLRDWSESDEPTLQKAFAEYGFGKVPDKLETDSLLAPIVIMRHAHQNGSNGNGNGERKK